MSNHEDPDTTTQPTEGEPMRVYIWRLDGVTMPHTYPDPHAARFDANGAMLSRSAVKSVTVHQVTPGTYPGYGPPILEGKRARKGAPIKWTEVAPQS